MFERDPQLNQEDKHTFPEIALTTRKWFVVIMSDKYYWNQIITARNVVAAKLCFHRRL